jgi:ABC-type bacteriocin/lantibiotic exporter with double-glycine peptidase domain
MDITINTPALLFPAISLIMLAYTNRFLSVAALIRDLHKQYKSTDDTTVVSCQITFLKIRLRMIQNMQYLGISSFVFALLSMYLMYINSMPFARISFALAVVTFACSLIISLLEIRQSTKALEVALRDMQD